VQWITDYTCICENRDKAGLLLPFLVYQILGTCIGSALAAD